MQKYLEAKERLKEKNHKSKPELFSDDGFYEKSKLFIEKKEDKLKSLQFQLEKQIEKEAPFKPQISNKSALIAKNSVQREYLTKKSSQTSLPSSEIKNKLNNSSSATNIISNSNLK